MDDRPYLVFAININKSRYDACLLEICTSDRPGLGRRTIRRELECSGEERGWETWERTVALEMRNRAFSPDIMALNQPVPENPSRALMEELATFVRPGAARLRDHENFVWTERLAQNEDVTARIRMDIRNTVAKRWLRELHQQCLGPTRLAIEDVVRRHRDDNVSFAFSGSGLHNAFITGELVRIVAGLKETFQLPDHPEFEIFPDPEDVLRYPSRIALGAAHIIDASQGVTLTSMCANGVFGVQVYGEMINGDPWCAPLAPLLGAGVDPNNATLPTKTYGRQHGHARIKIVCDPFNSTKESGGGQGMESRFCYDIFDVPPQDTKLVGRYGSALEPCRPEEGGGPDFLRFELEYFSTGAEQPQVKTRKIYRLPMLARFGSRRMHVDMDNVTSRSEFL